MPLELCCRYCKWTSEGYEDDMMKGLEDAKAHAKQKHKIFAKYWGLQGKIVLEMFTVRNVERSR